MYGTVYGGPQGPIGPVRRARGTNAVVIVLAVLLVIGVLATISVATVGRSNSGDSKDASGTSAPVTSTTIPRVSYPNLITGYCANVAPWPEVPPYVAGQPARASVVIWDVGLADSPLSEAEFAIGGSTVLSPHTDGKLISDRSIMVRTRAVACFVRDRFVNTGRTCPMQFYMGPQTGLRINPVLEQQHYTVTVYELHSGHVLHRGEIFTEASCPRDINSFGTYKNAPVAMPITKSQVIEWVSTHFVNGKPA